MTENDILISFIALCSACVGGIATLFIWSRTAARDKSEAFDHGYRVGYSAGNKAKNKAKRQAEEGKAND